LYAGITTTVRNVSIEPRPVTPERQRCFVSGNYIQSHGLRELTLGAFALFVEG
jgi:hypothetical protein